MAQSMIPLTCGELIVALRAFDPNAIPVFRFPDGIRFVTGTADSNDGPELKTTPGTISQGDDNER